MGVLHYRVSSSEQWFRARESQLGFEINTEVGQTGVRHVRDAQVRSEVSIEGTSHIKSPDSLQ
jgi:hypothetical protein